MSFTDSRMDDILNFWFKEMTPQSWFQPEDPRAVDEAIQSRFGELVKEARNDSFDEIWTQTPHGTLALLLLLDQFPRNLYRGSGDSFSSDSKAQRIATEAISKDFDRQAREEPGAGFFHSFFFYLPLMHSETLIGQVAGLALVEKLAMSDTEGKGPGKEFWDGAIAFTKRHRDCISQLGRFPKRNDWMGRETTEEEKQFLKDHPAGF